MNNRMNNAMNQIINSNFDQDKRIMTIDTQHFNVVCQFTDDMVADVCTPSSKKCDTRISFQYDVVRKNSFATNFQIKKFLRRFMLDAIKQHITRVSKHNNKGITNG